MDSEYLEYLNLYGTQVDDEGLEVLKNLPRLQKLYLWQSAATTEGIAKLVANKPRLAVHAGVDRSLFGDAQLKPPIIESKINRNKKTSHVPPLPLKRVVPNLQEGHKPLLLLSKRHRERSAIF